MANQNFRVKKGIEVGLGATFLYADDSGVGINSTSPRSNLDVRGRSQTEELLVDNYAEVQGPSTFVGVGTFQDDLYVSNNLYVKDNISVTRFESEFGNVTGILTANNFNVTGILTANNFNVTGVSTFEKPATFQSDILVSGASTLTGIVTTGDDLYVGGSLYVFNDIFYDEITGRNLSISGIATLRQLEIQQDLEVAGLSTFVGLVSFRDAVGTALTLRNITAHTGNFVEINVSGGGGGGGGTGIDSTSVTTENLLVTGVATFTTGVTTQLFAENILAGVVTTTDLVFNSGIGTSLTITNLDVTGIATLNGTGIATIGGDPVFNDLVVLGVSSLSGNVNAGSDLNVGAALSVSGDSYVAGVGTFASNLEVKGDLILDGDIELDTVIGDNLIISGVGTINTLKSNVGIITTANIEDLNVSGLSTVGILTVYEYLGDSKAQVGYGDSILATVGGKLLWTRPDLVGIATAFQPGSTFYVAENGSNANDGLSPEKAWASIAYALSQIPDTNHDILEVGAGEFIETFPLTVPKGLTIKGAGQRATLIKPSQATETNDGFLLNDRATIQDVTVRGFYKPIATQNYAFKLAVGAALTSRSPYIDRVTLLNQGTNTSDADPYGYNSANSYPTQAPGGGGVLIDGQVVTTNSPYASILANELTLFTPGSRGIEITNGGRMEWLNGFVYFASEALVGISDKSTGLSGAGKARLTLENASGGLVGGNTIEYYDSDGTTVLASGTIDSVSGSYVTLTNAGVGTFAVPRNRSAKKVDFVNSAQLSTAQAKFGVSSLDLTVSGTDNITVDSHPDFGFGTGDFTVEFWIYRTGNINGKVICDFRDTAATDQAIVIQGNGGNETDVYIGTTSIVTGTVPTTLNAWNHIAVCRVGSTITQYIDGAVSGSGTAATDLGVARQLTFGDKYDNSNSGPAAYLDELRVTKGASKYTGAFTSPSVALTGDKDTSILLHFDGINGATSTTDDIIVLQDIRITGGNTADKVTLADYSQFGADLRSISCAIEYGNQGIIANGDGVTLRAISLNFNHVGSLGDFTNDPNLAVQANEVIELNGGEVSYVSIDQKGDFRVGEAFYVNQETGEVSFTDTVTDLTALSSLTITDGTNSSIITPTSGRFGNVLVSGQSVESVTGDLNLKTGGSGEINIYGNTNVIGILTAQIIEINAIQKGDTAIALDDTGTDGTIRFITDGVEAQRITNQQRVGINTISPVTQLEVKGGTQLQNLNVTGIATLNGTGIATIGGDPVFNDLLVAGVSTFVGVGTFQDDLYVGGNLNVLGDIEVDEVDARNANITGIATVGFASVGDLRVSGGSTFLGNVDINGDLTIDGSQIVDSLGVTDLAVSGVATIGFLTVTDAHVGNGLTVANLTVTGDAQLNGSGIVTAGQDIFFRNLEITGLSTFVGLQSFITSVGTALTVFSLTVPDNGVVSLPGIPVQGGDAEFRNVNVTGVSSFTGVATFGSDVFVNGNLYVEGLDFRETLAGENLLVSGVGTINNLKSNVGIITHLSVTGPSTLSGIVTTGSDLYVGGNLYVYNDIFYDEINGRNLNISGVATIGFLSATDLRVSSGATFLSDIRVDGHATVAFATITEAYVGILTVGKIDGGAGDGGTVIGDDIRTRNLEVTGLSTFVGVSTFESDLYVGGNLSVLGDLKFDEVDARNANITGVTTVRDVLGVAATFSDKIEVTNLEFTDGIGETLGLEELTVTDASIGVATVGLARITDTYVGVSTIGFATITDAYVGVLTVGKLNGGGTVLGDDIVTRNLEVNGLSTFVGVSTFESDLYVNGDLNVLGDLKFDEVDARNANITGIATVGFASVTQANIGFATIVTVQSNISNANQGNFTNIFVPGIATIGNLISDGGDQIVIDGSTVITGIVTIGQNSITIDGNASYENIRLGPAGTPAVVSGAQTGGKRTFAFFEDGRFDIMNVNGITTTTDLNVTGVSTFQDTVTNGTADINEALIEDATIGVATVGFATINQAFVGVLTARVFDGGGTTIGNDITTRNLSVSGLSTFTGIVTTGGDLYVGGDLFVFNDIFYDEINGRNLNISGVSTLGFASVRDIRVSGASTFLGNVDIDGNLDVTGDLTFNEFLAVNANITGVATISNLLAGVGTITTGEITTLTSTDGTITTLTSTDATITSLGATDIVVETSTITTLNANASVTGTSTITTLDFTDGVGVALTLTNLEVTGTAKLGGSGIVTFGSDPNFRNLEITGLSTFVGVATFQDDLYVAGNLNVLGDLTYDEVNGRNLNISGIATIGYSSITDLRVSGVATFLGPVNIDGGQNVDNIQTEDLIVTGVATIGYASVTELVVSGVTTFLGPVNIDGGQQTDFIQARDLIVTGVATIGYASVTELVVDYSDMRNLNVSGIATIASLTADSDSVVIDAPAAITGIVTIGAIGENSIVLDGRKDRERIYLGDTGRAIISGITTDGDKTFVKFDDGRFDGLNVTGVTTTGTLFVGGATTPPGIGVTITTNGDATFSGIVTITSAEIGFATISKAYVGILTIGSFDGGGTTIGNDLTTRNLSVTGLSTFTGIVTTIGDLYVGGDLFVYNDIFYDEINGRNLNISGVSTLSSVEISSGIVTATVGVVTYYGEFYGEGSNLTGVAATYISLVSSNAPSSRPDGKDLVSGDLWFDSDELRQYTYYNDGVSTYWVDSNPQKTIPPLTFSGDSGVSSIDLFTEVFSIVGGNNIFTVGSGSTVTVAVSTNISVGDISADNITSNEISAGLITATEMVVSGIVTVGNISVGEISVGEISVGFVTATDMWVSGMLTSNNISSDDISVGFVTATDMWVSGMLTAQNVNSLSDRNLKEDIQPIEDSLSKVQQLNGVTFQWKDSGQKSMGIIAQEVESVFPELISGDNPKSVNYNGLIGVLIESIKELKKENDELRSRFDELG